MIKFYYSKANVNVSQDGGAKRFRCVGIFSNYFLANLLLGAPVK